METAMPASCSRLTARHVCPVWPTQWRCRPQVRRAALSSGSARLQSKHVDTYADISKATSTPVNMAYGRPPDATVMDYGGAPIVPNALAAARSLFAALNHRDVSAVLTLLADDIMYENLGFATSLRGRPEVGRFYLEALAALPEDAVFVLEEPPAPGSGAEGPGADPWVAVQPEAAGAPILQAGVAWHIEINGMVVPLSRGVGVYWADPRTGRLSRIWDNPEHPVKLSAPVLTSAAWASPLLMGLGPLVMPAARGVTSLLNTLAPGPTGSDTVAGGIPPGGSSAGGLAGGLVSAISSMMPFQETATSVRTDADGAGAAGGGGGGTVASGPVASSRSGGVGSTTLSASAAWSRRVPASGGSGSGGSGGGAAGAGPVASRMQPAGPSSFASVDDDVGFGDVYVGTPAGLPIPVAGGGDSVNSFTDDDIDSTGGGGVEYLSYGLPFRASTSFAVNLSGLWEKDAAASQVKEYEALLDVLQLGGLQKVTARLIDGLDLRQDEGRFEVGFVTVVPFFKVTERSLFGGPSTMMRRDLRSGQQTAQARRIPGGVQVDMTWGQPLAGQLREEYVVSDDGSMLAVTSSLRIGQRGASAMQLYRRSSRDKNEFLASQRSSYGSLQDVLRSQEQKFGKLDP